MQEQFQSRKVYLVNPPSIVEDEVVDILIRAEFEVVVLKDYRWIFPLLLRNPRAILLLNLEYRIPERDRDWSWVVDRILDDRQKHSASLGAIAYHVDDSTRRREFDLGALQLRGGVLEIATLLMTKLEQVGARGRRRYVRVRVPEGKSSLTLKTHNGLESGQLIDVSSAGFAAIFNNGGIEFNPETELPDIQIRLWGAVLGGVSGKVAGKRVTESGHIIHVVIFAPELKDEKRAKINFFVRRVLQHEAEQAARLPR